jgi:hypothetical protein
MRTDLTKTFDLELMCFVREVGHCPVKHEGRLVSYDGGWPDMSACINLFLGLDPEVNIIRIASDFAGDVRDEFEYYCIDGDWTWRNAQ